MSSEIFKTLLQNFGNNIGLSDLAPDEDDYCCLSIDDHLALHIKLDHRNEHIVLFAELGRIDEINCAQLYELLLECNDIVEETQGCTLAKIPDEMTIAICYQQPIKIIDQTRFESMLKMFLDTIETCNKKILEFNQGGSVSDSTPENLVPEIPIGLRV